MANVIEGINKLLYVRALSDKASMQGARLALQTTHTLSAEADNNTTSTKDGTINSRGTATFTLENEMLGSDDPTGKILYDAFIKGGTVEVWEVDFTKPAEGKGKYNAMYMQGKVTSWSGEDPSDDNETVSYSISIDGVPQDGVVTLEKEDITALQYAFKDLSADASKGK